LLDLASKKLIFIDDDCREPSWFENIRFRTEKAMKRDNIG